MNKGLKIISWRAPKDLENFVKEVAKEERRSISNTLTLLVEEAKKKRKQEVS